MTNATTATKTRAAKKAQNPAQLKKLIANPEVTIVDKHALTPAKKEKLAKQAQTMAKRPKASNQTAQLSAEDQQQIANEARDRKPGKVLTEADIAKGKPTAKQLKAQLAKELAAESATEGTVRAADMIAVSGPHPQSAGYHMVGTGPNNAVTIPDHKFVGALAEAAKLGNSYRAFTAMWKEIQRTSTGKLAAGLDGRNAPHSAKSVGDHNNAAKGTNRADKVQARKAAETTKKAARKAEKTAKAAPKADDNRKITILDKKFTYGREGSSRRQSWDAVKGSKTVADYAAKGGALKYLPRWAAAGAIKLG